MLHYTWESKHLKCHSFLPLSLPLVYSITVKKKIHDKTIKIPFHQKSSKFGRSDPYLNIMPHWFSPQSSKLTRGLVWANLSWDLSPSCLIHHSNNAPLKNPLLAIVYKCFSNCLQSESLRVHHIESQSQLRTVSLTWLVHHPLFFDSLFNIFWEVYYTESIASPWSKR